jgi:glycosyltransferase involved in cell wall biosynthesis
MPDCLAQASSGAALRGALYERFCRRVAGDFDVLISTYNLCDFGVPGIQCIADFSWDEDLRRSSDPVVSGLRRAVHVSPTIRRIYLAMARVLSRPSGRNVFAGQDLVLANSEWSARMLKARHGIDAQVLYPPVWGQYPDVPWSEREPGFVSLGRIAPEKRVEDMIAILRTIRSRGHDVHLHVIGGIDQTAYGRSTRRLCEAERDWVRLEGPLFGPKKIALLAAHRFAIHGRPREPFGVAVAETVKAGCVTFAPHEGGQAEIVNHPALLYESVEEAIRQVDAVLRRPDWQLELHRHVQVQGTRFTEDKFTEGLRGAIGRFLRASRSGSSTHDSL